MTFEEKVVLVDAARIKHPAFDQEFIEYLGLGHSFNGAYNYFTVEHVNKYNKSTPVNPQITDAVTQKPKTTKPVAPTAKPATPKE
jgi:hypothetical protein